MKYTITVSIKAPSRLLLGSDLYIDFSKIPNALLKTTSTNINFNNKKEFLEKMGIFLNAYKANHLHYIPHHNLLTINQEGIFPKYVRESLIALQEKYSFLTESKHQNQAATTRHINEAEKNKSANSFGRLKRRFVGGIALSLLGLSLVAVFSGIPYLGFVLGISALSGVVGAVYSHARELYLSRALLQFDRGHYPALQAIDNLDRHVFAVGEEAANWQGYFVSFVKSSTYTRPTAFAAGMKKQMDYPTTYVSVWAHDYIDFKAIDPRIITKGYWLHSSPMQTSIEVPTLYLNNIIAKLHCDPNIILPYYPKQSAPRMR